MSFVYRKKFKKQLAKCSKTIQNQFFNKLELLVEDEFNPLLSNHELSGELRGIRSFNVTGDIRVHFIKIDNTYVLLRIGSHSDFY